MYLYIKLPHATETGDRLLTYSIIYVSASLTTPTPPLPPPKKEKQNNEVFHVKPTCGNLEGLTGNAVTQVSLGHGVGSVGVATQQLVQDAAGVGGGATGSGVTHGGGGVDREAHGVLVLSPGDPRKVGGTVQGVVLDHRSAGGWNRQRGTAHICRLTVKLLL